MAKSVKRITIPNFIPRKYQLDFMDEMEDGCKRAVLVWHRRAGKEIACFNWMIKQAFFNRVGTYLYLFPTSTLGRRILWDGANKEGQRFFDYIPREIIEGIPNSVEMKVRLTNGSLIQIVGSDKIANVGINPVGTVFSEFSIQNPNCWDLIRPILRENGGWSIFNFTPRGKNHAHELYNMAKDNPDWFCQKLSIEDTGVLNEADMEKERGEGMSEHLIQQEYYCSFDMGAEGSFYGRYLTQCELDGRICYVPYDSHAAVDTFWDIGVGDDTVILFAQRAGNEIHVIDHYSNRGHGLQHYIKVLKEKESERGYLYGDHWAPHDIEVREFGNGAKSRIDVARELGVRFKIVPNIAIEEGIEHGRAIFSRLWLDKDRCKMVVKALENYQRAYNEKLHVYGDKPVHDWSSHIADAYRYMSVVYNRRIGQFSENDAKAMENAWRLRWN